MKNAPSATVTGYPIDHTILTDNASPPNSDPSDVCICTALVAFAFAFIFVFANIDIFWPAPPSFQVDQASVTLNTSSFNGTTANPAQVMTEWSIQFLVYNLNDYNTIDYNNISVSVKSVLGTSRATVLPGFQHHWSHPEMTFNVTVPGILPRLDATSAVKVPFQVYFDTNMRFLNWLHIYSGPESYSSRAMCVNMEIQLYGSQTQGTMLGEPVQCDARM